MLNLALYQPQIPQNTGTLMRLVSCLGIHVDLIRPLGFVLDDRKLKRAGMDYIKFVDYEVHDSFENFCAKYRDRRLIALDVGNNSLPHHNFKYQSNDILVVGSEHCGFSKDDLDKISHRVKIPLLPGRRSLNMAIAAAMVLAEATSQLNLYPSINK
jgi:tRNA (cytidine/uridine-2'-O-)-methyltransferase